MKKELVLVIGGAIILGLLIASAGYSLFQILKTRGFVEKALPTPVEKTMPSPIIKEVSTFKIEITTPEDQSLAEKNKIEVSGTTKVKSLVVIAGPKGFKTIETQDGRFQDTIELEEGGNRIVVTAYNGGESTRTERRIIYIKPEE